MISRNAVTSSSQSGQNRGPTYPANRLTDKRIFESGSLHCQTINIGRPRQRVPVAPQSTLCLIIRKKEYDVRFLREQGKTD